ncbi:MAG: thioredoxin [Deltaproteobacteria bacterium]|nr:thioredoxin [Deltaproteobacteria bacterium]
MSGNVVNSSDASFDADVLKSNLPTLVDFWAPWCGPCKSIGPVLEQIAADYSGRLKVVKVNIDDNPQSSAKYNVRGIPNLLFFKDGQVVDQIVGAIPKDQLIAAVDKHI